MLAEKPRAIIDGLADPDKRGLHGQVAFCR